MTHEHLSYEMGFWNVEGSSLRRRLGAARRSNDRISA